MTKLLQIKAMFLAGVLTVCLFTSGYAAVEEDAGASVGEKQTVCVDGVPEYTGYTVEGTDYVPLRSFCKALHMGAAVTHSRAGRVMQVVFREPAVRMRAQVGAFYLTLNDRAVYLGGNILYVDGNVLVPLDGICGAFGIIPTATEDGWNLNTEHMAVCADGGYDPEDLKWLSHIIHAEAGNQDMVGQICVGNVVLNRVRDSRFPDTVEDVIFSPNQFCPVRSGTIWSSPDEEAVMAAKLCLEGVSFAGESTYFVNPATGSTRWFRENLTYAMTVGDHDFYY
ncbi:MAG: cell wall hydrolase [Oscillospiraceae bacterium]|nr:cell wall hydrolase [Oscillospiraceae bacterium]